MLSRLADLELLASLSSSQPGLLKREREEEEEQEQEEKRERLSGGAELPPNSPHAVATSTQNSLDIVHKFASQLAKIYENIQT